MQEGVGREGLLAEMKKRVGMPPTCQVAREGGKATPRADKTLQKYSRSAASCWAPLEDRCATLSNSATYSSAAPAATFPPVDANFTSDCRNPPVIPPTPPAPIHDGEGDRDRWRAEVGRG